MKRISSEIIFDGHDFIKGKTILVNENKIVGIDKAKKTDVVLKGILSPAFVNAHCHLELSFLKERFNNVCSLEEFIEKIKHVNRKTEYNETLTKEADILMYNNGISVCADIVNTDLTANVKKNSKIFYVNFIELYGLETTSVNQIIEKGKSIETMFDNSYFTIHAPYSVSFSLLEKVKEIVNSENIFSIHVFESSIENKLFEKYQNHTAWAHLNKKTNNATYFFIKQLPKCNTILFVHNTFISKNYYYEILNTFNDPYFVICPNSNLRLSKKLPPEFLFENSERICIGTDSLASNNNLSIIDEINLLLKAYENVDLKILLKAATFNGAKALKVENLYGSFNEGQKPGIILLQKVNDNFIVKRLI
ncbi:MAG: amidohydrolase family protein [Bacteroidales bacterium]|nr:amidohydrolase family protein [Bacteroidales bacterium]